MTLTITPAQLKGAVTPPPSKSQAHRLLIAAALGRGESVIHNVALSQDIQATLGCLEELGAQFTLEGATVTVRGMGANALSSNCRLALPHLDCGESGSTLRFLIPVALAVRGGGIFTGRGRLMERPQGPYFDLFDEMDIFYRQEEGTLTLRGQLRPGEYRLPGNLSSQFVTGLLYALPLLAGDSKIMLTTKLESAGYVNMTLEALEQFGVGAEREETGWAIPGGQLYQPKTLTVEGDWSQAAFWYAAVAMGNPVELKGLNDFSIQGDRKIVPYFVKLQGPGPVELDMSGCPDLVPPLAAMAALRAGESTRLVGAARLRLKESDRLAVVTDTLCKLGAKVTEGPDFLEIEGRPTLPGGGVVDAHNDHRIAMMLAIAATRCERPITLTGAECVAKSYPDFWEEYERLGGLLQRIDGQQGGALR